MSPQVAEIQVETVCFPPYVNPWRFRGIEIPGKFLKVTAIGFYLEDGAVPFLAVKWKGKAAEELTESEEFITDVIAAPYERFLRVTMLLPLTGVQYSEKVTENCVAYWKSIGKYTDTEAAAVMEFLETFKDKTFAPGCVYPLHTVA
ncbi:hypothetical protein MLD38_038120 [Melastoma candidum]|uniref:Uncharacterized protein n=1 Tax=Melastoma candidum TaxID=119954 RepID=A0ACB9KY65_9MYRT|nr:hypothetical protein MLD38_038120 [Melastoma candidum]